MVPSMNYWIKWPNYVSSPPKDLDSMKNEIEIMNAANIEETTVKALKASTERLSGPDTTVCLFPYESSPSAGVTLDAGKISIFYSTGFSSVMLKSIVAHEYHHSVWTAKFWKNYKWDLLGNIIFEGRAEYFASLIYQPSSAITGNMNEMKEKKLWNNAKDSLHTTNRDKINTVLYGGRKDFPANFGYTVGYHIVKDYVKSHPDASVEDWSKLPSKELYKQSGYGDTF